MNTSNTELNTEANTPEGVPSPIPEELVDSPEELTPEPSDNELELPVLPESPETPFPTVDVVSQVSHPLPDLGDCYARDPLTGDILLKADGTPQKKRGRRPGQKVKAAEISPITSAPTIQAVEKSGSMPNLNAALTSQVIISAVTKTAAGLIGPEWDIKDKEEFNSLHLPLTKYLESQNVTDVPPGVLLLIAVAGYTASRFESQNTRTKLLGIAARIKIGASGLWARFRGQ